MVEIAVISDTHIPSREDEVPDWVADRVAEADHTIHAGDFDSEEAYETVVNLADGNLTAARGNTDPLSLGLPEVAVTDVTATTFVVTHGAGTQGDYTDRVAGVVSDEVSGPAIAVSGHTHEVMDEDVEGIRLLNPGSATGASPAERETMMTVEIIEGNVDVTVYADDEEVDVSGE